MTPIETQIVKHIINEAIKAGYSISIFNGEEYTINQSNNPSAIINAMGSTDQDIMHLDKLDKYMGNKYIGFVSIMYDCEYNNLMYNNGYDVIHDYSESLTDFMSPVETFAESLIPQ